MLLLDDVWEGSDLIKIGVPPLPEIPNGSKAIITTRFEDLCLRMGVPRDKQFRVEVLAREQALTLFHEKVGREILNSHTDLPQLSEILADRCKGLPLALVIVGQAMATKKSPEAWDQAIKELDKFLAEIEDTEIGLFHVLKLSYDSLRDDITKFCFIYRSFFPKEYEITIDELIEHWIGEGFFYGKDINEARRLGHKIIEHLRNACLLEKGDGFNGCIKMHDVIHDMARWIAQDCGQNMNKIWVCESHGPFECERVTKWEEAERISLWGRNIVKLPESPTCSYLRTLLVRECIQLKTLPRKFFQSMPLLRVLDLSASHCLCTLPDGVKTLINLEYINISMTSIRALPTGISQLKKLRCLLLDGLNALIIDPDLISGLSSLQLFSMYDGDGLSVHRTYLLEELESITPLDDLSLSFRSGEALGKLLTSYKLQGCIKRLSLHDCKDLILLKLSSIYLKNLETVMIFRCPKLRDTKINVEKEGSEGFERSYGNPNPESIVTNKQHFLRLRHVQISGCPNLLNLTWLIYAVYLQSLNVHCCESMTEVISSECLSSSTEHASIFTRLTSLVLGGIPTLTSIYHGALHLSSLEVITVINCPSLRRLPLNSNSAINNLKNIEGDLTWWKSLEWEDGSEAKFAIYFSPQYLADPIHHSGINL